MTAAKIADLNSEKTPQMYYLDCIYHFIFIRGSRVQISGNSNELTRQNKESKGCSC